jgi:ABC-type nitrate/sulfonate/bicarbonate transport system substrate-binding protein
MVQQRGHLRLFCDGISRMRPTSSPVKYHHSGRHPLATRLCTHLLLAVGVLTLCALPTAGAEDYFDRYGLSPASHSVDVGIQPLGYPSGVISAVMGHDRLLKKALADLKHPYQAHPFRRGADMVALLGDHRLEAGLIGDMPTILAAATGSVWIVGLVKQTSTAIIAKGHTQVASLVGKRIGYVETSSAHHTLLQGLGSAGLKANQVTLVPLAIDDMPDALERGDIEAFAGWEPAPSIALKRNDKNHIVFRGLSTDYFVIDRDFAKRAPEAAHHLVAAYLRAIEWMRRSQLNIEKAAAWAAVDASALSSKPAVLSVPHIVSITRREILDIPSAPVIPSSPGMSPLKNQFLFLMKLGKLPAGAKWEHVETALTYDGLIRVMGEPRKYKTSTFDYEN